MARAAPSNVTSNQHRSCTAAERSLKGAALLHAGPLGNHKNVCDRSTSRVKTGGKDAPARLHQRMETGNLAARPTSPFCNVTSPLHLPGNFVGAARGQHILPPMPADSLT